MRRVLLLVLVACALVFIAGASGAGPDRDLDGFVDDEDNCAAVFNPDQADEDDDGEGNTCDSTPGIEPDESKIVLYVRDQRGRPVPDACFEATIADGGGAETREVCDNEGDPGWAEIDLTAAAGSAVIEQTDVPPGCAGGLQGTREQAFSGGAWQIVDIRYRCGTPDVDRDYDGVVNTEDNCPNTFNPDQQDDDEDEVGNTCDRSPGTPPETSQLVLYLRDQDGAGLWNVCFKVTVTSREGPQEPDEECVDTTAPGWFSVELNAPDDLRADIVQTASPPGCSGGLRDHVADAFAAHSWRVVTIRFRCGAPATFKDELEQSKPKAAHTLRVVRATKRVELRLSWPRGEAGLDIAGLGVTGRHLAAVGEALPPLTIKRRRTANSLVVDIAQRPSKLKPGKLKPGGLAGALRFTVVGRNLRATARTTTRVTQH